MTPTLKSFAPQGNRVLVELVEETKDGTILIPEVYKKANNLAQVVAVGSGAYHDKQGNIAVGIGELCLLSDYGRTEIELDSKKYYLVSLADILGFFR